MFHITDDEFEGAIADALDMIPDEFTEDFENLVIMAQDEPDEEQLEYEGEGIETEDGTLLGLYEGISLLERADGYGMPGDLPDRITIFKKGHEALGDTREEVLEEVKRTVIHEVGHYFGMDEDEIDEMGYA